MPVCRLGHLVLVDVEREKDRVCFGTPAKLALATICDGIPSSTCRPDLRHCAAAVDSVPEAESRLLAEMDQVLAVWLKRTVGRKTNAAATGEAVSRRRNKRQSKRLCNAGT